MNYDITDYLFVLRLSQQYMLRYFSGKNYFFILEDLANTIKYSVLDCSFCSNNNLDGLDYRFCPKCGRRLTDG